MPVAHVSRRTAGEGSGHTARAHASESHCGIVPMHHSNKDGTSLAESEEGRLRIKENTRPFDTYPTQSGKGVSQLADVRKAASVRLLPSPADLLPG